MQPPAKDTHPLTYYVSDNVASISQRKKKKRTLCPHRAGLFYNDVLRRKPSGEWVCAPPKGCLANHPVVLQAQRFTLQAANLDAEHIGEVACALYPQMLALQKAFGKELRDGVFIADVNIDVRRLKTMPSPQKAMHAVPSLCAIHYAECQSAPEFMRWTIAKLRQQLQARRIAPADDRVIFACTVRYSLPESVIAALTLAVALDADVAKRLRSGVREKMQQKALPMLVVTGSDRPAETKSVEVQNIMFSSRALMLCWLLCQSLTRPREVVAGWRFQLVDKSAKPDPAKLDPGLDTIDELGCLLLSHTALCAGESCAQNLKEDLASTTWAYKLCARCKFARFCNDECLRNHWKQHKTVCDKISVVADEKKA